MRAKRSSEDAASEPDIARGDDANETLFSMEKRFNANLCSQNWWRYSFLLPFVVVGRKVGLFELFFFMSELFANSITDKLAHFAPFDVRVQFLRNFQRYGKGLVGFLRLLLFHGFNSSTKFINYVISN